MLDLPTGFPVPTVCEILDTIKALSHHKSKVYFAGGDVEYGFDFRDACTQKQVEELEKSIGYKLPNDYKQFLLYTNGLELSTNYISSRLCCMDEIYQIISIFDMRPDKFLVIGECAGASVHVAINLAEEGKRNIYIVDIIADEHFHRLNCDFRTYLDRFIATYGDTFWEWGAVETDIKQSVEENGWSKGCGIIGGEFW